MVTIFRDHFFCLLTSERWAFLVPSAVEGAGEGAAGANKESEVLSEASCYRCGRRLSTVCGVGCSTGLEDAFDVAGAILRAFENASRAPRSPFCHRMSQKTHRVPQEPVLRTEYPFRTGKACFLHRMPLKMRRVPEEAFLSTECVFRTVEACFWYGALRKRIALGCPEHRKAGGSCL